MRNRPEFHFPVVAPCTASYTESFDLPAQSPFAQTDYSPGASMQFTLIDRILELEPGVKVAAVKSLTMAQLTIF